LVETSPEAESDEDLSAAARHSAVTPEAALKNVRSPRLLRRQPRQAMTDGEIQTANEHLKLRLRRGIAIFAGLTALGQVICADVVFVLYAQRGMHWRLPVSAIEAWLAATVIQVIGIVLVITRSLFPTQKEGEI